MAKAASWRTSHSFSLPSSSSSNSNASHPSDSEISRAVATSRSIAASVPLNSKKRVGETAYSVPL